MHAKRLHRTEHGFHYDNKVPRLLAAKMNQRNGETKLKMKILFKKKKETCKRPQQNQRNQKPQPNHMIFTAFFLLTTRNTLPQAKCIQPEKKDTNNRTENAGLGKP
jgi:hypothetical protein